MCGGEFAELGWRFIVIEARDELALKARDNHAGSIARRVLHSVASAGRYQVPNRGVRRTPPLEERLHIFSGSIQGEQSNILGKSEAFDPSVISLRSP